MEIVGKDTFRQMTIITVLGRPFGKIGLTCELCTSPHLYDVLSGGPTGHPLVVFSVRLCRKRYESVASGEK